jgi:ubiquinone/menaquinone biosynthesis C-methylase UbiE
MKSSEFDKFAHEYAELHRANVAVSGEGPEFFAEYKIRDLRELCASLRRGPPERILDFGAGIGGSVAHVARHFPAARLTCVDVSMASLRIAAQRFPEQGDFVAFDGGRLPFADASFDCVFSACVFHHIEPALHVGLLAELRRVLRPGGLITVFEHNPLNPLTVRAVRTCPFDENAILLRAGTLTQRLVQAGFAGAAARYRLFFPHALRALRPLEQWLQWLPLGAQYYVFDVR